MIDLEKECLDQILSILGKYVPECKVLVFGSRVEGRARRFSDLDLALIATEKVDWRRLEALKDAFSESDLQIIVDVLDWHAISDGFRKVIERQYEVVQKGKQKV